jgi:hypothetical protein
MWWYQGICASVALHYFLLGPCLGETPHIFEVPGGKPGHLGRCSAEVTNKPVDYLGPPPFSLLPLKDVAADSPVQENQLAIDGQTRTNLGRMNPLLQLSEEALIAICW